MFSEIKYEKRAKIIWIIAAVILFIACNVTTSFQSIGMNLLWALFTFLLALLLVGETVRRTYHLLPNKLEPISHFLGAADYEFFSFMTAICTYPFNGPKVSTLHGHKPIVLVHGNFHNNSAWIFLKRRLEKAGHSTIYAINSGPPMRSVEYYSNNLAKQIDAFNLSDKITLIGHSIGGVISSYYASQHPEKVSTVITLGSPLEGTKLGMMGLGKGSKQTRYQSPFIQDLQKIIANTPKVQFYFIGAKGDLLILPNSSAMPKIEGCDHVHTYEIPYSGHMSLLYSERIANWLCEILQATNHK